MRAAAIGLSFVSCIGTYRTNGVALYAHSLGMQPSHTVEILVIEDAGETSRVPVLCVVVRRSLR
jgi:hypothetical protein